MEAKIEEEKEEDIQTICWGIYIAGEKRPERRMDGWMEERRRCYLLLRERVQMERGKTRRWTREPAERKRPANVSHPRQTLMGLKEQRRGSETQKVNSRTNTNSVAELFLLSEWSQMKRGDRSSSH